MQKNEVKKQLMSEPQGLVYDVVAVEMISNEASLRRQPGVIQVEEMQLQAINTLRPQGVVFGVEAGAKIEKRRTAKLSMESLPVGFRFTPTDEQLINHYLRLKNDGCDSEVQVIPKVVIYRYAPWKLPGTVCFFFILPNLFYFL